MCMYFFRYVNSSQPDMIPESKKTAKDVQNEPNNNGAEKQENAVAAEAALNFEDMKLLLRNHTNHYNRLFEEIHNLIGEKKASLALKKLEEDRKNRSKNAFTNTNLLEIHAKVNSSNNNNNSYNEDNGGTNDSVKKKG